MSNEQIIPIEHVKNDRALLADDSLAVLRKSMKKSGQMVPIILDKDMNLIDGARRLQVLVTLQETTVKAVIATTLEETTEVLLQATTHGVAALPLTPRRAWEIFAATGDQQRERGHRMRHRRAGLPREAVITQEPRARELLATALGLEGESFLATSALIYKAFTTATDPVRLEALTEIIGMLEAGTYSLYQARGALERLQKGEAVHKDAVTNIDLQRDALATALSQLRGTIHGIERLGDISTQMQTVEVQMYLRGFEEGTRVLRRFINTLRKRATEQ